MKHQPTRLPSIARTRSLSYMENTFLLVSQFLHFRQGHSLHARPHYLGSNVAMPNGPRRTSSAKSRHFHACSGMNISGACNLKISRDFQTHLQNVSLIVYTVTLRTQAENNQRDSQLTPFPPAGVPFHQSLMTTRGYEPL